MTSEPNCIVAAEVGAAHSFDRFPRRLDPLVQRLSGPDSEPCGLLRPRGKLGQPLRDGWPGALYGAGMVLGIVIIFGVLGRLRLSQRTAHRTARWAIVDSNHGPPPYQRDLAV